MAVSSPSGDVEGAEEAIAVVRAFLPDDAETERVPCSTPDCAPDLIARLSGSGTARVVLLGHVDTVVSHEAHRAARREGDRIVGPGTIDMKGGDALALGALRELAERPELYAEASLLLVTDEEWRTAPFVHTERFAGYDACLCFEAGERTPDGEEAVIVKRKAAGTLRVEGHGRAAHSGSAPQKGRSALLALAAVAQRVASVSDAQGPERLTAVPTIMHSGEAFNVVPPHGHLLCDLRADSSEAFDAVLDAIPAESDGVRLEAAMVRAWPGMDSREAAASLLGRAGERLGRSVVPSARGGASDASHMGTRIPLTIDGLGPRGGAAHNPDEWVSAESLRTRAEVAMAVISALLEP